MFDTKDMIHDRENPSPFTNGPEGAGSICYGSGGDREGWTTFALFDLETVRGQADCGRWGWNADCGRVWEDLSPEAMEPAALAKELTGWTYNPGHPGGTFCAEPCVRITKQGRVLITQHGGLDI